MSTGGGMPRQWLDAWVGQSLPDLTLVEVSRLLVEINSRIPGRASPAVVAVPEHGLGLVRWRFEARRGVLSPVGATTSGYQRGGRTVEKALCVDTGRGERRDRHEAEIDGVDLRAYDRRVSGRYEQWQRVLLRFLVARGDLRGMTVEDYLAARWGDAIQPRPARAGI